ncbi:MAG TPA: hypothetical protein VMA36_18050 [Candidatus Limnocylindria bacterium]|nr:hypothetical protein [Candidatus Limnocylindria bacterium]
MLEIERFCADSFADARRAAASREPLKKRLVGFLDARIGAMYRLLAAAPDVARAVESDPAAAAIFRAHEARMNVLLRTTLHEAGIADDGAVELFLAAAVDALRSGDIAPDAYRARLRTAVDAVLRKRSA